MTDRGRKLIVKAVPFVKEVFVNDTRKIRACARHGSCRRKGRTPDAFDKVPCKAGGALRRKIPHNRLRPLKHGQQRALFHILPYSVQKPVPPRTYRQGLAVRQRSARPRFLRQRGPRADVGRRALVRRNGGRGIPEHAPGDALQRGSRLRLRGRPRIQDGR